MKKLLLSLPLVVLLVAAVTWGRSAGRRQFATASECVEAYYHALKDGDVVAYRACVSGPLRRDDAPALLAADLKAYGRGLHGWTVRPDSESSVIVDEQYSTERRRRKVHLERDGTSWRVARVDLVADIPADIPYGTHIGDVPDTTQP